MAPTKKSNESKKDTNTQTDVRISNITSAKAVADCIRTSLGPRGMDKMIISAEKNNNNNPGETVISNDGATILTQLRVTHPCAKMLVELSKAQDVAAGDGTTSVVVLCGALLHAVEKLLLKGIHPTQISECFHFCAKMAEDVLEKMSIKINIKDEATLIQAAVTSLNSKVIAQNSDLLAPMAVRAVSQIIRPNNNVEGTNAENKNNIEVDLNDIRITSALGGTIDDTELILNGMIFKQAASHISGGPRRVQNAVIALIQFQLSPPKTNMESVVNISDYTQMDRALKDERKYLLNLCKQIRDAGVNVLLIQKSVLRDAVTAQSLDYLAKMKIMVVKDVERKDIDFITKTLGCLPVANVDNLTPDKFGYADLVEEESTPKTKLIKITGVKPAPLSPSSLGNRLTRPPLGRTVNIFLRGSNQLMLEEAERALHDALCVIRSLVKRPAIMPGGGAGEMAICLQLGAYAREKAAGAQTFCMRAFADAFEVIPYTLSENAGLSPMKMVTELRNAHLKATKQQENQHNQHLFALNDPSIENHPGFSGINVRKGTITNMITESVVQPLLVSTSAVRLATECVMMILKIDDIIMTRV